MIRSLLFILFVIQLPGQIVREASYDTDSYLFIGTNNEASTEISLNPHTDEDSHFNFGVIRFDLEGLTNKGTKTLSLNLKNFVEGSFTEGFSVSDTGSATVHLVALSFSYDLYLEPSTSSRAWYDLALHGQPIIGTFNFESTAGDGIRRYTLEVTETVNAWLADPESNYGFGLWAESGSVDLSSSDASAEDAPLLSVQTGLSYTAWLENYYTAEELNDQLLVGWDADPDGDHRPNALEYRTGTHPREQNYNFWQVDRNKSTYTVSLDSEAKEGSLILESSENGTNWTEVAPTLLTETELTFTWSIDNNPRLYRLRVMR